MRQQYPLEKYKKMEAADDDRPTRRTLLASMEPFHRQPKSLENTQGARRQQVARVGPT